MPLTALVIALGAAVVHAFWNLVVARSRDTQATTAVAIAVGVAVAAPFAILRWRLDPEVWPFIAVSSVLELVYFWLLTTAYRRADMSLVYPIARGMAPVIVLVVSVAALGVATSLGQALGVAFVGLGVILVRGLRGGAKWSDVALALGVASSIAGYTLVDKEGVRFADPVTYITLILIAPAIVSVLFIAWRGGWGRVRAALKPDAVVTGIGTVTAYALVLVALTMAPAASVAAVREVSVVFATALGAFVLKERVSGSRWAGAIMVALGVALVVAG
ncbi:MAG: EamA family transporter [Candidatus Limnocylindrales bacterium]